MGQEAEEAGHPPLRLIPSQSTRRFSMLESRVADPVSLKKTRFRIFVDDGPDLEQMVLLFFLLSIQNSLKPEI